MRVGFDVSDIYLDKAGIHTYASQLLTHLARLPDSPALTLVDAMGRTTLSELMEANHGTLPSDRLVRLRKQYLFHLGSGPWQKDYRTRRLAWNIDSRVLMQVWQLVNSVPLLAQRRLSDPAARDIDLYHWSDKVFMRLPGVAGVVTIHDAIVLRSTEWHTPGDVTYYARRLRLAARYATRLIAVSEYTKRDVVDLLGVDPARIDVIPEAAGPEFAPPDPIALREVLARYGLAEGRYVFYVGTIEPRKNLVRLAHAFKAAVAGRPELADVRLALAGQRGWMTESIDAGLEAAGLGDRLVLPGRVPQADLPALLAGAGAVAYVSLYEGFGLPPLEALACGAAVVASNTTAIPEVVGDAGLLVDPEDVGDIAGALGRVLADGALRAELRAKGLRRAGEFSWAKTAQLTLQTYGRAIAENAAGAKAPARIGRA